MNKLTIIGNLTADPQRRSTADGIAVCSFTVAVNRRGKGAQAEQTDFFRVTAWRGLAENCVSYLSKGRKVAVTGSVHVSTYTANNGETRASLDVTAEDVEFLTPRNESPSEPVISPANAKPAQTVQQRLDMQAGWVQVPEDDELPF